MESSDARIFGRRRPLAVCIQVVCALAVSSACADVRPVLNCADAGPGSLRAAVGAALSGDTIDASGLSCGTITLSSGEIAVEVDDLTIAGPGTASLMITGSHTSRVVKHTGTGTLTVRAVTIADGHYAKDEYARGGCIFSAANVTLDHSAVTSCTVSGATGAAGGGVFATSAFHMYSTRLIDNAVTASGGSPKNDGAAGGGAWSESLVAKHCTISGNVAEDDANVSVGGGLLVASASLMTNCTVDHNTADDGGGVAFLGDASAVMGTCTISGNVAHHNGGGIFTLNTSTVQDTTIAFNQSGNSGGGVYGYGHYLPLFLTNVIVANNVSGELDDADVGGELQIWADYSLIMVTAIPLFPDTLRTDPQLEPLNDNGGDTLTHAIGIGSPALDSGRQNGSMCDQRGLLRVFGAQQDIGAYEYEGDRLLGDGFEVCRP